MIQRYEFELFHCNGGDMSPDDNGAYVSYEDYAALKEAAEKALAVLEDYEVQIDGEWGACRNIDQLYEDGTVNDVLPLLKGLLHVD